MHMIQRVLRSIQTDKKS